MPWTKAGNIRGPEGPAVPLDGLTDVNVAGAATGSLLIKMPDGTWQGRPNAISNLNSLTDVTAPANTVAGKLLGTTATGQWAPVDAPTTGWGKWSGTQAQYDALATKDPNVLYVITG
jgi:hypothetical protein